MVRFMSVRDDGIVLGFALGSIPVCLVHQNVAPCSTQQENVDQMKFSEVEKQLTELSESHATYTQVLYELVAVSEGNEVPLYDALIYATSRRACAIVEAFCDMVRADNHFVAPALIRMHVDHLLTLYAALEYEGGPNQYVERRFEGHSTRSMKNKHGKRMFDTVLVGSIVDRTGTEWIRELHQGYSDFVHFGAASLYSIFETTDAQQATATMVLTGQSSISSVTANHVRDWISNMQDINRIIWAIIQDYTARWVEHTAGRS